MTLREKAERYGKLLQLMDTTRKNKRYGRDSVAYEVKWASQTFRDLHARFNRTFRVDGHYAFLTSIPKWREIIATNFSGRMADHELCDALDPYFEIELHDRTYNNRKEMGCQAAINQVMEDIYEVSEGYTKPCRVIKWDLAGYFPNAICNEMEKCFIEIIENNRSAIAQEYGEWYPDYLRWLTMICKDTRDLRTPLEPVLRWLNDECNIRSTLFMDDCVMVVPEEQHQYALGLLPELRKRLGAKGVKLNEKKFYDQPYHHGLEFLGSHIRPNRIHLNSKTVNRCKGKILEMNRYRNKEAKLEHFVSSMNSYFGLLKNRTDYYKIFKLMHMVDLEWWDYCYYNVKKRCITVIPSQQHRRRLERKYSIK